MEIKKQFRFDAAHFLPGYEGKCSNKHGHTYRLDVVVSGKIKEDGVVIDFKELKDTVNDCVISELDHSCLNDIIENPTAENTIKWAWKKLENKLPLKYLELYESQNSSVIYRGSDQNQN